MSANGNAPMKLFFGGLVSVVLLGLYLHLIRLAIQVAEYSGPTGCGSFNENMAQSLSIVSGLVSALVIAELAAMQPGDPPLAHAFASTPSTLAIKATKIVTTFYVLAWLGGGFAAYYVGLHHPKALPALTTLGQTWLGLAVSAAYAYFGINQTPPASKSVARNQRPAGDAQLDALR